MAYLGRSMQRQADNRHYMIAQVGTDILMSDWFSHTFHLFLPQSLAFLSQYRNIRLKDQANVDEVEFNFGRAFHQIGGLLTIRSTQFVPRYFSGLFHHASKHYHCVLDNTERRMKDNPTVSVRSGCIDGLMTVTQSIGVSREAAYNLSLIYMATGATPLARVLYRKWLSI